MKIKIVTLLVEKILGISCNTDQPRADMYLPSRILAFGIVLLAIAIGSAIGLFFLFDIFLIVAAPICLLLGIGMIMCWRNQSILIIDDRRFEYKTFLGRRKVYHFSDIQRLRKNPNSMTLFVAGEKVHMEACAILSEHLANKINEALAKKPEV